MLPKHVPAATKQAKFIGNLASTNELQLAIGLPLRDGPGLDRFLAEVYDPASPNFRHFLTPAEFAARFGPSEQDYAAVQEFARTNGFSITKTYPNRLLLNVRANVADVQRAFHITLKKFKHPKEARDFFAPDTDPMVDAALPVADVSGLSDFSKPHPKVRKMNAITVTPRNGSAPDGVSFIGPDFRNAYVPGTTLDGAGQMVGLLQFDGFNSNDIVSYENLLPGSPRVPLKTVLLDGFSGGAGGNNIEVCLDIEMAIAMAPGLSQIVVFEGNDPNSVLNAMASSNMVKNLSCSWGWSGGPSTTTENIFKTMAAQGQSFFNASGDNDAYPPGAVDDPANSNCPSGSPNITQVGGTTLTMNGAGASYASETVWNSADGTGSGGGVSSSNTIPVWQQGISMAANGGSTSLRNIPDVTLVADNIYVTYDGGSSGAVAGTSCAAPLWAGFMALVNQRAAAVGNQSVGFANPAIYELGRSANYNLYFHDTTVGDNTWSGSSSAFYAVTGYDLCTGWGTPNGTNLINALAIPNPLVITPAGGFVSAGPSGGPFSVTTQTILLTNTSGAPIKWALSGPASWLTVGPSGGTLGVGEKTNVTVALSSAVDTFPAGVYSSSLSVTNLTGGIVQAIPFELRIGQSLVANGGFEAGYYTDWTLANNGAFDGVVDGSTLTPHTGTYCFAFGQAGVFTLLSQNLATIPGQSYLVSFWLSEPGDGSTQQFKANWNTNSTTTNTVYNLLNAPAFAWKNVTFVATATGTDTTLQFAAQNDPYYFGLDDVSVMAIPAPSFTAFSHNNNTLAFTWNSLPGVSYQVQYSTNLSNSNWLILSTNVATADTTSFTNTIGGEPQRFFRIRRLP